MYFFLENRIFSVKAGEACSSWLSRSRSAIAMHSEPSVVHFVYIYETILSAHKHGVQVHVYADDTTLYR